MKKEKYILTVGLILSIILAFFRVEDTIRFSEVKLELYLYKYTLFGSGDAHFTSAILGYLLLLIFISEFWKKAKNVNRSLLISFVILTSVGFLFELYNIIECLVGSPNDRHFWIGLPLAIFGLYLVRLNSKTIIKEKTTLSNKRL